MEGIKKNWIIFSVLITVAVITIVFLVVARINEDSWICSEGKWIRHGSPSSAMPETLCPGAVACTLDARICPDGSAVGRQGPDCEFAPCPGGEATSTEPVGMANTVYQDSKIGLEFQYPKEWPTPVMMAGVYTGGYPQTTSDWCLAIGPIYGDYYGNEGYPIYLTGFYDVNNYAESLKALKNNELISNIEERMINGNRAIVFNESGIVDFTNALIFGSAQKIKLNYNGNSDLASGFEKILETFKFTK